MRQSYHHKPRDVKQNRHRTYPASGHAPIDRRAKVTDYAAHDGVSLREGLIDPNNTASDVWADSAYRSAANEWFLAGIGKVILRAKALSKPPEGPKVSR